MKSIAIVFDGGSGTFIDWKSMKEGKECITQKYLVNIATEKGTDPIFPDRGTDLLPQAIGGVVIDAASALMIGNFAATDTIYFCAWEEDPEVYSSGDYPEAAELIPTGYSNNERILNFDLTLTFQDGTSTTVETTISSNG